MKAGAAIQIRATAPTRAWVLRTDEDGVARIDRARQQIVSSKSDALYLDMYGYPTIPLGTITARETKAPDGYTLGDVEPYIAHVVYDLSLERGARIVPVNYGSEIPTEHANTPVVPEPTIRGDVGFIKRDTDIQKLLYRPEAGYSYNLGDGGVYPQGDADFSGAVFEIVNENDIAVVSPLDRKTLIPSGGVVCRVVTDEDGYAATDRDDLNGWGRPSGWHGALAYGRYSIREVSPPNGYALNADWRGYVTITKDGFMHQLDGA